MTNQIKVTPIFKTAEKEDSDKKVLTLILKEIEQKQKNNQIEPVIHDPVYLQPMSSLHIKTCSCLEKN